MNSRSIKLIAFTLAILFVASFTELRGQIIEEIDIYPETTELFETPPTNDPVANEGSIDIPGNSETDNNYASSGNLNFGLTTEVGFSPTSKYIKIPLSIGYKNFSLAVSIPFYIQKKTKYSHGYESSWGLGDISVKLAYVIQKNSIFDEISFATSMPSGNQNKMKNGYLVPLGTGSFDYIFSNSFQYKHPYFRIYNNLTYRISGKCHRTLKYSMKYFDDYSVIQSGNEVVNYVTTNGNFLSCNTTFDYPLFSWMSLHAGFAVMNSSKGKIRETRTYDWKVDEPIVVPERSANQNFTSIEIRGAIGFSYWGIDLMAIVAQPVCVITDNPNIKDSQKFNFYIKLSKKIF